MRETVEEYFNRFYEAVELLGGEVLSENPQMHTIAITGNQEEDGNALRHYLGLSDRGPVGNLIKLLENSGILVCLLDIDNEGFSGMNGSVNGRPYIVTVVANCCYAEV